MLLFIGQYVFTVWLENKLEDSVQQQTNGVYRLELYGFETSPFIGNLSLDSLMLKPDYQRWQQLKAQGQDVSRTLLDLKSREISVNGLSLFKMIFNNNVNLDSLVVQQPDLMMTVMMKDTTSTHKPMHETVDGLLQNMKIGKIDVDGANFRYRTAVDSKSDLVLLKDFHLTVHDYQLDSASFYDRSRAYYSKSIVLKAKSTELNIPNGYYKLTSDSVALNTSNGSFTVRQVSFEPTLDPTSLAKAKDRAVTWMKAEVPTITAEGINYGLHSRANDIDINRVLILEPNLNSYKDKKNFEEKGEKPLPHDLAQSATLKFRVGSIEVKDGYTRYEELAENATETGHIYFTGLNGSISNLTNRPEGISRESPAVVKVQALLMGKARMQATVSLPLLEKNGYHTLEGSVSSGDPKMLNPILIPTNFIKVDKGQVHTINFNATLDRESAKGSMKALYNNLEIELLSKGATSGDDQGLVKNLISEAANAFLIKESNPDDKGEQPRIGEISVSRKKNRSFITYWKDCLASGIMASMGLEKMAETKFK